MRLNVIFYIVLTTLFLVTATIMSVVGLSFNWVFFTSLAGQVFLLVMVYKILTDDYQTEKTFDDWYEDNPIDRS